MHHWTALVCEWPDSHGTEQAQSTRHGCEKTARIHAVYFTRLSEYDNAAT